ncbi:hypothetical protein Ciccas_003404 [Cichlidogyrus casuarinus]|uniref:Uncharacterized protein n=1 Tax=Cichlidogyrus casuarinus TaxID=1844966 RepID=A0ABD2QEH1_9PLAT
MDPTQMKLIILKCFKIIAKILSRPLESSENRVEPLAKYAINEAKEYLTARLEKFFEQDKWESICQNTPKSISKGGSIKGREIAKLIRFFVVSEADFCLRSDSVASPKTPSSRYLRDLHLNKTPTSSSNRIKSLLQSPLNASSISLGSDATPEANKTLIDNEDENHRPLLLSPSFPNSHRSHFDWLPKEGKTSYNYQILAIHDEDSCSSLSKPPLLNLYADHETPDKTPTKKATKVLDFSRGPKPFISRGESLIKSSSESAISSGPIQQKRPKRESLPIKASQNKIKRKKLFKENDKSQKSISDFFTKA